jgi:hypothetical protein
MNFHWLTFYLLNHIRNALQRNETILVSLEIQPIAQSLLMIAEQFCYAQRLIYISADGEKNENL